METRSREYKEYLLGKYLPGRRLYLNWVLYPQYLRLWGAAPGQGLLDLGCGNGEFLQFCRRHGIAARGVDSNGELVAICRGLGLEVVQGDILQYQPPAPVSWALCDNVLEHLDAAQVDAFFANCRRLMQPGGRLLVVVPGPAGFRSDPTHRTYISPQFMQACCARHAVQLAQTRHAPINVGFLGRVLYLNMTIYRLVF